MFKHILPNIFYIIIVTFTLRFPAAVGTEVIMSYLGIGVQNEPSWGLMIESARMRLWQGMVGNDIRNYCIIFISFIF